MRFLVRENWTGLFAQVPDLRATSIASTIDGDLAWAEWHWQGIAKQTLRYRARPDRH